MSNRYQSTCPLDCKVYVGGLTRSASREEIERIFAHYGKIRNVFVARNPPGFAFVEYEDPQDAEDSVRGLDGRNICGVRARVEISHGKSRGKMPFRRGNDSPPRQRRRSRSIERRRSSYSRSSSRSRGDRDRERNMRDNGRSERNGHERETSRRKVGSMSNRSRSRS